MVMFHFWFKIESLLIILAITLLAAVAYFFQENTVEDVKLPAESASDCQKSDYVRNSNPRLPKQE